MWSQRLEQRIQHETYGNNSLRRTYSASNRTMHTPSKESHSTCEPMHRPMTCLPHLHCVRIYRRTVRRTGSSKCKRATNLCFAFRISNSVRPEEAGPAEGRAGTEVMESEKEGHKHGGIGPNRGKHQEFLREGRNLGRN